MGWMALSGGLPHLVRGTGMLLLAVVAEWGSLALWTHQGDAQMIWLPGPLLLAALLSEPRQYWIAYDAGWFIGMMAIALLLGLPLPGMLAITTLVLLAIHLAALLLSHFGGDQPFDDFSRLMSFIVIAVVVLPLVSATAVAGLAKWLPIPVWLPQRWWHVALADALGYVLLPPAIISLANPGSSLRRDALPSWGVLLVATGALVLLWLGWRELGAIATMRPLMLLAPVPLAIFVALRAQIPGASVVGLVIGIIAIQLSLSQQGPFVQSDPALTTISVQLWVLGMAMASLFLAALVEQRRSTQRALNVSCTEVRELAGRLIVAQEQERARIARELHDDINQRLAVASMRLSALRRKVGESNRQDVSQLQNDLISLSADVRHLSHDLHPSMLTQMGLTAALAGLCQTQRHQFGPAIDLKVSPQAKDLPEDVSLCLYRVTQEALSNAVKHAQARQIEVTLLAGEEQVDLTIRDNGRGFIADAEGRRGLGLMSIDERTKLLGGSCRLYSIPGKGTELCICIPLGPSTLLRNLA